MKHTNGVVTSSLKPCWCRPCRLATLHRFAVAVYN